MQHSEESARLVKARLEKTTLGQVAKSISMRLHSTEVSCPLCPPPAVPSPSARGSCGITQKIQVLTAVCHGVSARLQVS